MTAAPVILLVEDDHEHLRLTKYIFRTQRVPGTLHVARDGQEALDFLHRRGTFAGPPPVPRPHLIMLDLNIPRINGRDVLRTIRQDPDLGNIPVVVLSSSDREEDIRFAREAGAVAYISKAAGFEQLSAALAAVHTYARTDP